jgi:hypothetical protein
LLMNWIFDSKDIDPILHVAHCKSRTRNKIQLHWCNISNPWNDISLILCSILKFEDQQFLKTDRMPSYSWYHLYLLYLPKTTPPLL